MNNSFELAKQVVDSLSYQDKLNTCYPNTEYTQHENFAYRYVKVTKRIPIAFIDIYHWSYLHTNDSGFIVYAIRPEFQHQGLSKFLLFKAVEWAKKKNKQFLVYKALITNENSLNAALKFGFNLVKTGSKSYTLILKI